jgi:hypothetical protein
VDGRLYTVDSTQGKDEGTDILEHELPAWVLEFLLSNTVGGVVGDDGPTNWQKFSFMWCLGGDLIPQGSFLNLK